MLSMALLLVEVLAPLLLPPRPQGPFSSKVFAVAGALAVLSGVINSVLLAPSKNMLARDAALWKVVLYVKLGVVLLLFTPLSKLLPRDLEAAKVPAMLLLVLLASWMRFFREGSARTRASKAR